MQCPYYVHRALARPVRPAGRQGPRRPVRDRRRVWRQGGIPVDHRRARRAAGLEGWASGEDRLRPRGRHGGDDEASPVENAPPDGRRQPMAGCSRWTSTSVIDGGAYCTLSPVVLSRGTIHAAGPYRCEQRSDSRPAVATNEPPHGAFRGFGAPQSIFALERQMDRVAQGHRHGPCRLPAAQLHPGGRDDRHRPGDARADRPAGASRSRSL